jgi:hypothetical protein
MEFTGNVYRQYNVAGSCCIKWRVTNCLKQSPSGEANRSCRPHLVRKFSAFVWNSKVHYRIHNSLPPVPILSQINPVHYWRSSLIAPSHLGLGLPSGLFTPGFPTTTLYVPLLSTCHMPRPSYSSWFDHQYNIGDDCRSWSSFLCSFLHSPIP